MENVETKLEKLQEAVEKSEIKQEKEVIKSSLRVKSISFEFSYSQGLENTKLIELL